MPPGHRPAHQRPKQHTTVLRWAARRRRTALTHALRGACYGIGTGTVSLASVWLQRLL